MLIISIVITHAFKLNERITNIDFGKYLAHISYQAHELPVYFLSKLLIISDAQSAPHAISEQSVA